VEQIVGDLLQTSPDMSDEVLLRSALHALRSI
jgi:hypothetical protein